jgi:hypothetical protein
MEERWLNKKEDLRPIGTVFEQEYAPDITSTELDFGGIVVYKITRHVQGAPLGMESPVRKWLEVVEAIEKKPHPIPDKLTWDDLNRMYGG